MGNNLLEAFPNAARVAFTGTPLITERHGGKRTVKRFGEYIDTDKLMDSVADGATLQILYEGRTANTALRDKAEFDAAFEDLFAERTPEELLAIKKKYGATGDILEAEKRISAIARDIVRHYVDNILPNGFKAQVVCHSKLAAVRYQRALRAALDERLGIERAKDEPDRDLIRRVAFLKVAVVVSADPTNESAEITAARKEAKAWGAVENFCKPFDFDDPDKANTGIALLVVCDMLLTGFDAPIEQVMYVDKRLKEHNLLQAIARVNRVAHGKQRGFIVDYIGLANHLTDALTIYADEDLEDLQHGLKDLTAEIPILEERYRRLLQHFKSLGVREIEGFLAGQLATPEDDVRVVHKAVDALEPIKARADFEVYLKKFLTSRDLVMPGAAAQRYRAPARRLGYLMRMTKERFKDDSIDFAGVASTTERSQVRIASAPMRQRSQSPHVDSPTRGERARAPAGRARGAPALTRQRHFYSARLVQKGRPEGRPLPSRLRTGRTPRGLRQAFVAAHHAAQSQAGGLATRRLYHNDHAK